MLSEQQYNYRLPVSFSFEFSGTQLNFLGCKILNFGEGGSLTSPWSVECEKTECVFTLRDLPIYKRQTGLWERPGAVIVHYMQLIYIYKYI